MWIKPTKLTIVFIKVLLMAWCAGTLADDDCNDSTTETEVPPVESVSVRLLYGESHGISWTDLELPDRLPSLLKRMYMDVYGLDYHYQRQLLFFSGWDTIWRMSLKEGPSWGEAEAVVEQANGVTSVGVDWLRDRVYWVSPQSRSVQRADLEGGSRTVVLQDTGVLTRHNNLVLDPHCRYLFLATDSATFIRSNLDGGDVRRVAVDGHKNKRLVSLAIAPEEGRLYVSCRHDHEPHILSCGYDGTAVVEYWLTDEWWSSFVSIGVFEDQLFWAHRGGRERDTVWKANVSDGGALRWQKEYTARGTILDPETKIWVLKVYHPDVQAPGKTLPCFQEHPAWLEQKGSTTGSAATLASTTLLQLVMSCAVMCYI